MHQRIKSLAKVALSIGLIVFVLSRIHVTEIVARASTIPPWIAAAALLTIMLQMSVLPSIRTRLLLASMGIRIPIGRLLQIAWAGFFFEQATFNFVGGDIGRLVMLRRIGVPSQVAAHCLIIDRLAGFCSLFSLSLLGVHSFLKTLPADSMHQLYLWFAVLGVLGVGLLLLVYFDPFAGLPLTKIVRKLLLGMIALTSSKKTLLSVLSLSLLTHLGSVSIFFAIGSTMGMSLTFIDWLLLAPSILFLSMLPISVSGWGIREGAMIISLGLHGVPSTEAVVPSVVFGFGILLASLPGGLIWTLIRDQSPQPTQDAPLSAPPPTVDGFR